MRDGLVLPGWFCMVCRGFVCEAKEQHEACIYCGAARASDRVCTCTMHPDGILEVVAGCPVHTATTD